MKIEKNSVVALSYTLEVEGAIADQATAEKPLEYIQGMGMLLPRFEEEVAGKEPGDNYEFTLSPEEGYGVKNPDYVFDIPKAAFEIDGVVREELLVAGRTIPMLNSAGQVVQGTVAAVGENSVSMDFNHPMAGKTLHFTGTIVSVRESTEKERTEGLHGEFLPQEEGSCHCGKKKKKGEGCDCEGGNCNCEGGNCKC